MIRKTIRPPLLKAEKSMTKPVGLGDVGEELVSLFQAPENGHDRSRPSLLLSANGRETAPVARRWRWPLVSGIDHDGPEPSRCRIGSARIARLVSRATIRPSEQDVVDLP